MPDFEFTALPCKAGTMCFILKILAPTAQETSGVLTNLITKETHAKDGWLYFYHPEMNLKKENTLQSGDSLTAELYDFLAIDGALYFIRTFLDDYV